MLWYQVEKQQQHHLLVQHLVRLGLILVKLLLKLIKKRILQILKFLFEKYLILVILSSIVE